MSWIENLQNAINYIEDNITDEINIENVAKIAYSSKFHFQKVFGILTGVSIGEYVRLRRLSFAGEDLLSKKLKIIDVAFKYGYNTPESFSRAFFKFHGILPSKVANGCGLKTFAPIHITLKLNGGTSMDYKIKTMEEMILVGYKKRFTGVPYGEERSRQEEAFFTSTRAKQWLLIGASSEPLKDYCIVTNIDENGYDFYICYKLDDWTRKELYNHNVTGVKFMEEMNFEEIKVPKNTYAIFETKKTKRPISKYIDIRKQILVDWLPSVNYIFKKAPEICIFHWRPSERAEKERFIEICIPIVND